MGRDQKQSVTLHESADLAVGFLAYEGIENSAFSSDRTITEEGRHDRSIYHFQTCSCSAGTPEFPA